MKTEPWITSLQFKCKWNILDTLPVRIQLRLPWSSTSEVYFSTWQLIQAIRDQNNQKAAKCKWIKEFRAKCTPVRATRFYSRHLNVRQQSCQTILLSIYRWRDAFNFSKIKGPFTDDLPFEREKGLKCTTAFLKILSAAFILFLFYFLQFKTLY